MLLGLFFRVYRDRRRLAFVALAAFFAGFIMYLRADLYVGSVHVAWVTGAIYAMVVGFCALLVCLFLPSMRFMIEAVAVSRLFLSGFIFCWPDVGQRILADPMVTAGVIVLGGIVLSRFMHGRILRARAETLRDWIVPRQTFQRAPARVIAGPMQFRFVSWIDNAEPVRV